MKINKKILHQVSGIKSRQMPRTPRGRQLQHRLTEISNAFDAVRKNLNADTPGRRELFRYFPIALVGSIQGYFSLVIKNLVDQGEPYTGRIAKLSDFIFGTDALLAFRDGRVTLGDVVSRKVSLTSPSAIYSTMDILLDDSFCNRIKSFQFACPKCGATFTANYVFPKMFKEIEDTYQLRNILCHEMAIKQQLKIRALDHSIQGVWFFLSLSESILQRQSRSVIDEILHKEP